MSVGNANLFYEKVKSDWDLQQKIGQFIKEDPKKIEIIIIRVAQENGYDFTVEEMRTFAAEKAQKVNSTGELSDSELETVSGGTKANRAVDSVLSFGVACVV